VAGAAAIMAENSPGARAITLATCSANGKDRVCLADPFANCEGAKGSDAFAKVVGDEGISGVSTRLAERPEAKRQGAKSSFRRQTTTLGGWGVVVAEDDSLRQLKAIL
jgi:hypothetical protein